MKNVLCRVIACAMGLCCLVSAYGETALPRLRAEFISPPSEYTQVPFWFWNDEITEQGIVEQITWMEQHGVYGFLPHARIGLSKNVGYMTDRWLELVRFATDEAAKRGMMVYLYDEGMYPSGSAHGKVVEGRPDLASQGLRHSAVDVRGPKKINQSWPLEDREKPVAAVLMKKAGDGVYEKETARVVPIADAIECDVPEGDWTLFLFVQTPSGGVIRGVHWDEEDNQPNVPKAADLLNPEAVQRFIEFTHEKYYAALKDRFGKTVRGMFTDEPSILAKRSKRGLQPWTNDFLPQMNEILGYDFTPYLPLLWAKASDGFESAIRLDFQYALDGLLNQNYYTPLSKWCAAHNIALTGHPDGGGDVSPQVYFQEPGQDVVWRWVLPGKTSLEGEQSTLGKSATSAAAQLQRPVVINECYGAYGWRLTMDEMKWLADWLFVRGTNRLFPHAFYYSVREQRIYERPPDLSWEQLWADHYRLFSDYTNRLSWLQSDSVEDAPAAILTIAGHTPWTAAKALFQNQIDFHYLDETLMDRVDVENGALRLGDGNYKVLILDGIHFLTADTARKVLGFLKKGANLISLGSSLALHPLRGERDDSAITQIQSHPNYRQCADEADMLKALRKMISPSIVTTGTCPDLRIQHRKKSGVDFFLLTNEGEGDIKKPIVFVSKTRVPEVWNAEDGSMQKAQNAWKIDGGVSVSVELSPRQSRIYVYHSECEAAQKAPNGVSPVCWIVATLPSEGWKLTVGDKEYDSELLGTWTAKEELLSFSGTGWYEIQTDLSKDQIESNEKIALDLGEVQSWAQVEVNGVSCGTRLWRPFLFDVSKALRPGKNKIRVGVTNTRANELTKEKLPSGLFGPVRLIEIP